VINALTVKQSLNKNLDKLINNYRTVVSQGIILKREGRIETLIELGLTAIQAKIYLSLLQTGPSNAKNLAATMGTSRPDVYRIIEELHKDGVIEKLLTKPAVFKAAPADQLIESLLKRKLEAQKELNKKSNELLTDLLNNQIEKESHETGIDFIVIQGKDATFQKLKEALSKVQTSVYVITSQRRFSEAVIEFHGLYGAALKRGVKIWIATENHIPQKKALRIMKSLMKNPNFEVKYFTGPPSAHVAIFDSKDAYSTMSNPTISLDASTCLWSRNASFVELVQSYFEKKWSNSEKNQSFLELCVKGTSERKKEKNLSICA
jgi:sugar-specific transcriptional regulator TrmB